MKPQFNKLRTAAIFIESNCRSISSSSTFPSPYSLKESLCHLLDFCSLRRSFNLNLQVHSRVIVSGFEHDSLLSSKLISLFSSCGKYKNANAILDQMPTCNSFILNAMIKGYSTNGLWQDAVDLFHQKTKGGVEPDSYTFSCTLKACASLLDMEQGKELHELANRCDFASNVFVGNALMCMYAKCGSLEDVIKVFGKMPEQDTVSWTSIISAYVLKGCYLEAAEKLKQMIESGFKPDQVTVLTLLTMNCTTEAVSEIHGYVIRNGLQQASMVQNSLVSAYGKCARVKDAHKVFDGCIQKNRVTWNALISSYAQNGLFDTSMQLLRDMKHCGLDLDVVTYSGIISSFSQNDMFEEAMLGFEEMLRVGLKPDAIAIASVLPAVSGICCFGYCKEIHAYSYRNKLESDRRIRNALVSVYSKFSSIQSAERIFTRITDRDVISWSSMVMGYAQNENFVESLNTFREMLRAKIKPNPITITSVLSACAGASGLGQGKEVHSWAIKNSFDDHSFVGSALMDMYTKCGKLKETRRMFDLMEDKNLVTYNVMIGAYAVHGLTSNALEIFQMVEEPDQVSFIAALSACSHGGEVEEGIKIFNKMKDYKVSPREGHYACMIDLLARSGRLEQALDLIRTMPMEVSSEIWGIMLGACKIYSNLDIGVYTGTKILEKGSGNSGYYVLLSNILADFGRWEDVTGIRELMEKKEVKKVIGCSWIEVNKVVYSFVSKDRSKHPQWENLSLMLNALTEQMRGMGH